MPRWIDALKHQYAELRRRRVFRSAGAYLVFAWLLLQIADATFQPLGLPLWSQRALIIAVAAGFLPVCILAWIFDITTRGLVRTEPLADQSAMPTAAPALVTGASSPLTPSSSVSPIASIAILPFADLSQAHDQDWFCDGLAEEIIDSLCCVRGLRVASRTASFRFRDGSVDPREIGRQLAVDAILEGSVRKADDRLKVTAQLIDASDGYHLWSESYERRLEDVFAIQTEIARNVAQALKFSLSGPALGRSIRYAPSNIEAYEYYLRGRQMGGQTSEASWRHAPKMFRRAIELDPNYAQALAGLADSLAQQILWRFVPAEQVLSEAAAAAAKALDLAPDLAEAHVAQGHIRSLAGDRDGAIRSFERAIELNPALHEAYYYFARHCFAQGDFARAAELFQQAYRTRPDEYVVLASAVGALDAIGDRAGADAMVARALPGLMHQHEMEPENARLLYMAAGLLQRQGRREEGRDFAEKALRLRPDDFATLYNVACFYSLDGDCERALDLLERAIRNGGGYYDWIMHDSDLAALRELPRFQKLVTELRDMPDSEIATRAS
jgi:adenylate cyclase